MIAPVVAALSAFVQAKIHDQATAALIIAIIGAIGLYYAPAGDTEPDDEMPELGEEEEL